MYNLNLIILLCDTMFIMPIIMFIIFIIIMFKLFSFVPITITTVLPAKSDSDAMFCLQSNQGLRIDRSLVN